MREGNDVGAIDDREPIRSVSVIDQHDTLNSRLSPKAANRGATAREFLLSRADWHDYGAAHSSQISR